MDIFLKLFLSLSLIAFTFSQNSFAQVRIGRATCEDKPDPMGVNLTSIHFSWQLESRAQSKFQSAYQLVIATSVAALEKQGTPYFNSGRVTSNQNILLKYTGKPLKPGTTYYWKVKVWDEHKLVSGWSSVQQFTTGLFDKADWKGAGWIAYEDIPDSMIVRPGVEDFEHLDPNKCRVQPVVPLFRKSFTLNRQPVKVLAFVTGVGQYELSVNGHLNAAGFLAPGWTYYEKKCLYNSYDLTAQVKKGDNAIGLIVGNGFYNINRERYIKFAEAMGTPRMICTLKITYEDGTEEYIISDKSWKTAPSPLQFSSIYGGETYDAGLEQTGWNAAGFDDRKWQHAIAVKSPGGKLEPEKDYPVTVMDTLYAKKITRADSGGYLYDFAQNASGIVQLSVKGHKGDTIKLIPAELIDSGLIPNQHASGAPYYFTYILKGGGTETWTPKFSYYGFRYVLVQGAVPDTASGNGVAVISGLHFLHTRNSTPAAGSFYCSDTLFNKINTLIQWAIKSNMQSIITDCPHREKLGWMEQDYLMGNSIQYNFHVRLLYKKLVADMMDAQTSEGLVPDIAPEFVVFQSGFRDSPEWGSACVILPWLLYKWYGDTETVQLAYTMMKKYVSYLEHRAAKHILSYGLGDWYDYGPGFPGEAQLTPKSLTATAIYYYDVLLLGRMASILKDRQEAGRLQELSSKIRQAFNAKFFNPQTRVYSTGSQTAMALPLCVGLVNEKQKAFVLKNLIDSISRSGKVLTAGDIGFHFLVQALDEGGASQLIYEMNNRNDVPGYGFQLKRGATALTESWQALREVSNNHLMLGHIMEWFYSGLAGIAQEKDGIAYRRIKIRPQPVGNITAAKGSFESPYGWIKTDWKKEHTSFKIHVEVPVNARAVLYLPASASPKIYRNRRILNKKEYRLKEGLALINITSGIYDFESRD